MQSEHIDKEFIILENIYNHKEKVRQRELSHNTGISLGMTNMIVKRLVKKGMLVASKINRKNIHYAVTPNGIDEIMKRSYRYFKRTMGNIVRYKSKIEGLINEVKGKGYSQVCLIGKSDVDFIIEHFCNIARLKLLKRETDRIISTNPKKDTFYVYSENAVINSIISSVPAIALYEWLN